MVTAAGLVAAGIFTTAGVGAFVVATIANLAISAILGSLLAPDAPSSARDIQGLQNTIKSPIAPRKVAYGECVLGGVFTFIETSGTLNSELHLIYTLTGHPVEDIIGVWLDDEYINIRGAVGTVNTPSFNDLSSDYYVDTGKFGTGDASQHVKIIKNNGWGWADKSYVNNQNLAHSLQDRQKARVISTQLRDTDNWKCPAEATRNSTTGLWPEGHKQTNCSFVYFKFKFNRDVFSGFPQLRFHVKGKRVYNPYNDVNHTSDGAVPPYNQSIDNPDTWLWSEDWTLCTLDFLLNDDFGVGAIPATEIDWKEAIKSHIATKRFIDSGLPSPNSKVVPTYTINGVFETNSTPIDTLESLMSSAAGSTIYSQGKYKLKPAIYRAPDIQNPINENMLVSPLSFRTHTPRSELFNKISGVYVEKGYDSTIPISTNNKPLFIPNDFPLIDPLDSSGLNPYEVIDGEEIIKEIDLPFCVYSYEAQRIARIHLEKIRQGLTISFEANLEMLKFSVGDNVYFEILSDSKYTNEPFFNRLGLDDAVQNHPDGVTGAYYKQFMIVDMQYTSNMNISVTLKEESEEIYDWNNGDANLIDYILESQLFIDDPTGQILKPNWYTSGELYPAIRETTFYPNLTTEVRWLAPDRGSDEALLDRRNVSHYEVEYGIVTNESSLTGDGTCEVWLNAGTLLGQPQDLQGPITINNLFVGDGFLINLRVRSLTYIGRASAWAYYKEEVGTFYNPTEPPVTATGIPGTNFKLRYDQPSVIPFSENTVDNGDLQLAVTTTGGALHDDSRGIGGTENYDYSLNDVKRIIISPRSSTGQNTGYVVSTIIVGDTITVYYGPEKWYKFIVTSSKLSYYDLTDASYVAEPFSILVDLIDYRDTNKYEDPSEYRIRKGILPSGNVDLYFEKQIDHNTFDSIVDSNFDLTTDITSDDSFWSIDSVIADDDASANYTYQLLGGVNNTNSLKLDMLGDSVNTARIIFSTRKLIRDLGAFSITITYKSNYDTQFRIRTSGYQAPLRDNVNPFNPIHTRNIVLYDTGGEWKQITTFYSSNYPAAAGVKFIRPEFDVLVGGPIGSDVQTDLTIDSIKLSLDTSVLTAKSKEVILTSNVANIDPTEASNFHVDLLPASSNVTFNIVQPAPTLVSYRFYVSVVQDTTNRTITWASPYTVAWEGGSAPTMSTGSGSIDIYEFFNLNYMAGSLPAARWIGRRIVTNA